MTSPKDRSRNRSHPHRRDSSNEYHSQSRECSCGVGESCDNSHSSYRTNHRYRYRDRDCSRRMKRERDNESLLSRQKKYVKDPVEIHNIKQKDGEIIEDFMERFKVKTGSMKGAPECIRISGFMHGVNNLELTKRLNEHVPKTMEETMITTVAFIRGEAVAAGKKKGHTSWRTQDQSKRHTSEKKSDFRGQPREGRGSSRFYPLTRTPKEILMAKAEKFQPPPPMQRGASSYNCRAYGNNLHSDEVLRGSEKALSIDKTWFVWKGKDRAFERGLQLLTSIDLSSNKLSGKLPNDITSLRELVSLNFSFNKLHGEVPKDIGQLKSLQSLDLSRNEFYGIIPTSLSQLTFLGYLDLSNNDLSGRIPSGPQLQLFNFSFYSGNPQLCGPPLTQRCAFPPATTVEKEDDEDADDLWKSDVTCLGAGFAVGFLGICGTLLFNRWCRNFLFALLSQFKDWMYVTVVVQSRKLQRKIRRRMNISICCAIVSS
nr:putative leucine-rich repeat domain, L domain-like protein [Tanacetum cinerariifolium]